MAFGKAHRWIDRLGELPVVFHVRRALFARRFRRRMGHAFHGVFDCLATAQASLPAELPRGYDNPASAGMYVDRLQIDDHDHPALFWLQNSLAGGMRSIADLGGSTGIKYFAFRQLLDLPTDVRWRVIETPAAVQIGREIAARQGAASALEFSSRVDDADGFEVLFASGSLQYLPQSLGEILAGFRRKPRRILVNTTPIHATRSFFTLNNIGTSCCTYRVTARDDFTRQVTDHGYRLRDHWRNLGKVLPLPFAPGHGLEHYSGFCFDRATDSA